MDEYVMLSMVTLRFVLDRMDWYGIDILNQAPLSPAGLLR